MRLDSGILGWAFWVLVFSLLASGKPWRFPQEGDLWLKAVLERTDSYPERRPQTRQSHLTEK
jgi:hypothetical protein